MLVPSLFTKNFVDDFFNDAFDFRPMPRFRQEPGQLMNADIREFTDHFEMELELPGFKKEDLDAKLKDGYLTISARRDEKKEEKDAESGRYIRRERYVGKVERTFYVGEDVTESDIKAGFENGILKVSIPKIEKKPQIEEAKRILID